MGHRIWAGDGMIEIRVVEDGDVAGLMALYRAAGLDSEGGFTAEEATERLAEFRRYPSYRLFVAVDAGELVGTYSLLVMDKLTKRGRRVGVVDDVGVSPEQQGKGIGRAMMEHAMEECRAAGCYKMMLSSNLKRTEAHAFYERLGFERHGWSFVVSMD